MQFTQLAIEPAHIGIVLHVLGHYLGSNFWKIAALKYERILVQRFVVLLF
jgi:uncharacterized membrane protein YwzB